MAQYCDFLRDLKRASGATETIPVEIGPSIEAASQSAQKVAPGCVADKLRIMMHIGCQRFESCTWHHPVLSL